MSAKLSPLRRRVLETELNGYKAEFAEKKANASAKQGDLDALGATRRVVSALTTKEEMLCLKK